MNAESLNGLLSPNINELAAALAKAQGEMDIAGKDNNNPFFKSKYADFATIVKASRPALSKHGLSVSQPPVMMGDNGTGMLVTILLHSSGQYITSSIRINPLKTDHQSLGSCLTYLKRYAYAAIIGVVADDEDDDGETAMVRRPGAKAAVVNNDEDAENQVSPEKISQDQYEILINELDGYDHVHRRFLQAWKVGSLRDVTRGEFREALEKIRMVKAAEGKKK
jgi:hypothetical protein